MLDLRRDQVELAIRHGKGNWPGVEAEFLLDEVALPVAAPGYLTLQPGEALLDAQSVRNNNRLDRQLPGKRVSLSFIR